MRKGDPHAGWLVWLEPFAPNLAVEQSGGPKGKVAHHLGIELVGRPPAPVFILRVWKIAPAGRGLLKGTTGE